MKKLHRILALAAASLLFHGPAMSDDTDLFVQPGPVGEPPNVLLVIDNAGNFSGNAAGQECVIDIDGDPATTGDRVTTAMSGTVGGIEQCALHTVINALPPDSVKIGIMVYNDSGVFDFSRNECVRYDTSRPGGCLIYPLTLMSATNKANLLTWIRNWTTSGNNPYRVDGSNKATGGVMQEAWAYYKGRTGVSGRPYGAIQPPTACNNYVVFVGNSYSNNGSPGDQTGDSGPKDALEGTSSTSGKRAFPAATAAQTALITRTIRTSCPGSPFDLGTNINNHENRGRYADEWARYMLDQDITTYSIGVLGPGCQSEYEAVLTSMAGVGGGRYFPTRNYDELVAAFQSAFSEMLSVNSVFASVSLPVSVNTQGTFLNQVYIGMFRPDRYALPRWAGNLKQYRLGMVGGSLRLLDAQDPGQPAISSANTGFISTCARSYWTPTAGDTYWQIYKNDPPFCSPYLAVSNTPDGNFVEKGGQGYTLRGSPTATSISRNLKTCNGSCGSSLAEFDSSNTAISKTLLGNAAMSDDDRTALINWARGQNNKGDEIDSDNLPLAAATAMRPSVHGDVVHSRPVAINFGAPTDDPPKVVVFYGGNDGVLRAVNGNRTASIGSVPAGHEMWSFIAPEFYPYIKRLRDNNTQITFLGNTTTTPAPQPKPYGFDGPLTSYTRAGDTWIFGGMRRGGRMIYAFDVSDITDDPNSPALKWRLGCPNLDDDVGCTSVDITDIGQTWSSPTVLKASGYFDVVPTVNPGPGDPLSTNVPRPMLIMGGGYDSCEDADPNTCTSTDKGNRIYVLDPDTGSVLRTFNTDRGVVGDVFVVTNRTTGLAQWAYAADLGGNIYRISGVNANTALASTAPGSWTITKIAALGCDNTATCTANRKFMFAPDVVVEPAPNSGTHILLIGSGDREKPLRDYTSAYGVSNYFFMLKDVPSDSTWLSTNMGTCPSANVMCLDSLYGITGSDDPVAADLANKKGWYLGLNAHEQVVTSAITVFGGTTFSTHTPTVPDPEACASDLGTARVYNIRYNNAAPSKPNATNRYEEIKGGGLPPSPVAGQVKLDGDGPIVPFIIGADPRSPLEGGLPVPPSLTTLPKSITYWYIEK